MGPGLIYREFGRVRDIPDHPVVNHRLSRTCFLSREEDYRPTSGLGNRRVGLGVSVSIAKARERAST